MHCIGSYFVVFLCISEFCISVKYLMQENQNRTRYIEKYDGSFANILLGKLFVSRRNKVKLDKIGG